jgi:transglutaminase-like putative cysteine protease
MMAVEKILQLLASLVALTGVAPAFLYLDWLAQLTIPLALIGGLIGDRRKIGLLRPLPATLLSFLFGFFYLAQMSRSHIVEPLINLLVLLLAVRLLTEKSGRNLLQIFVLSTFILAASSLLSLNIGYLVSLVVFIVLVTFGLLLTSFYATDPHLCLNRKSWLSLLRTGSLLPLCSLVLMLFFFAILPRTQHPLWNFLNPGPKTSAGFSEQVNPGSLANLGLSGEPAFRAKMAEIDPQDLYWRGLVLNIIDGRSWKRDNTSPPDQWVAGDSTAHPQIISSEARSDRYLPGLDLPGSIEGIRHSQTSDAVFRARRRLDKPVIFSVDSFPRSSLSIKNPQESDFYLRIPERITPRMATVADEIAKAQNRRAKIQRAREFFIRQKLSYATLNLSTSESPVDNFLFESKRGYCEYFASSFALLLRLSGVPTRLVGGYLGGRYNEMGGYYLIDEDMAHVWVEALDDAGRWQRIDPSRLAINAAQAVTGLARRDFDWTQAAVDYIDNAWTRLVITYDLQKQLSLIFSARSNLRQLRPALPEHFVFWLAAAILTAAAIILSRRRKSHFNSQQRLLKKYLRRVCKSAELKQLPQQLGLFKLAELSHEPLCHEFARIFGQAVYRDRAPNKQEIVQLRRIIKQIGQRRIQLALPLKSPRCSSSAEETLTRCND